MSLIKFNAALTERVHQVEVPQPHGAPVALRLSGMKAEGASSVRGALTTTLPRIKPAAPSQVRTNAPTARVMSNMAAMELPWSVNSVAAAIQEIPDALKGTLFRGAITVLGPRMASLALPTLTLVATLYSPSAGEASLPFVPLNPKDRADAEGFDPLDANDQIQQGVPHTEYTRPHTPVISEHPISAPAGIEVHEGARPVQLTPLPGKAQQVPHWMDGIHLATKKPLHPATSSHLETGQPVKQKLTFTDVVVSDPKARDGDGGLVSDKRLTLKFQTGAYGGGEISVWSPDPFYRNAVQVDFKKTSQLPDGPAGEILAHALGYTHGFTPTKRLFLKIENTDTPTLVTKDSVSAVTRWAVAMHGKRISSVDVPGVDGYAVAYLRQGFRAAPRFFEKPNVPLGYAADGPGLDDPEIFMNRYPRGEPLRPTDDLPSDVFLAQDLTDAVRREQPNLPAVGFSYVIPVTMDAEHPIRPLISLLNASHSTLSQGRSAFGAGAGLAVYDPNFGSSGGYRNQFLTDINSQFEVHGKKAKHTIETAFQKHLDTDGRFFPSDIPASVEPFAGMQVRRESAAASPTHYVIKIPDARALSYQGTPLQQTQTHYADLASMVIEPVQRQVGQLPLARISEIALDNEMRTFLPTFVGQALAAVHLTHPATREEQAFGGLLVSQEVLSKVFLEEFVNGLTIYGIEKKLGEYSPEVPFVLQRVTESGDIELTINPAVRMSR